MDRLEFLKLCQKRATGKKVFVTACGTKYIPIELRIWFDKRGFPHSSGVLKDIFASSSYLDTDVAEIKFDE